MSARADISADLGPARDQGRRGTCLAFAVGAAHEIARVRRRGGGREELGEELLYWRCKQIDADGKEGTGSDSAGRALRDPGHSAAALWPYDKTRDETSPDYQPPTAALEAGQMRRATLSPTITSPEKICGHLAEGQPVVLGLDLWPDFFRPRGGELAPPQPDELLGAPHAVTVVGYGGAGEWLLIRNSWGVAWGERGHARLLGAVVEVAGIGAWVVEDDIDD